MDRNRKHITGRQGLGWTGRGGLEAPMARVKVKLTISSDFKIYVLVLCTNNINEYLFLLKFNWYI